MAHILIYAMNYAPEIAGVGRCTGEIGEYLAERGHEVTVVTTPPHYPGWKLQPPWCPCRFSTERRGRQKIIRCPLYIREKIGGVWRLIAPLSFAMSSAPVVIMQILKQRPDAVLCIEPTLFGAPAATLAASLIGARRALHAQDLEVDAAFAVGHLTRLSALKVLAFAFERFCLRRFEKVLTISDRMADRLAAKGVESERLAIVRNWVDLDRVRPTRTESPYRKELGFKPTDRIALYSGNIGAKQGFETVVAAAEALRDESTIKFVIAGEGPEKVRLQARAASIPNMSFLPFQPYERLGEFLTLADVHVLPQSAGAADLMLPSKLGGMLASGKPIVVTTEPNTELAAFLQGSAICVPPERPAELAAGVLAALTSLGDDEARRGTRLRLARLLSRSDGLAAFEEALVGGPEATAASRTRSARQAAARLR